MNIWCGGFFFACLFFKFVAHWVWKRGCLKHVGDAEALRENMLAGTRRLDGQSNPGLPSAPVWACMLFLALCVLTVTSASL